MVVVVVSSRSFSRVCGGRGAEDEQSLVVWTSMHVSSVYKHAHILSFDSSLQSIYHPGPEKNCNKSNNDNNDNNKSGFLKKEKVISL